MKGGVAAFFSAVSRPISFVGDLPQCPVSSSLKNSGMLNSSHGGREKASQERSSRDFGGEQIPLANPPIPEAWG